MRRNCAIVAGLSAVAAMVLLLASGRSNPQLSFEGKPLTQWLDNGFEDASRALYEIGPASASCIFEKLKTEHPEYSTRARYAAVFQRCPPVCRKFLPNPKRAGFDEHRASEALLAIGPAVVPVLSDALVRDDSFLVRSVSAQTLLRFQQRGRKIECAYPALRRALDDPDPEVQKTARLVLAGKT